MNKKNDLQIQRIEALEQVAKDRYLDEVRWFSILECLTKEEYLELKTLYNTIGATMGSYMNKFSVGEV